LLNSFYTDTYTLPYDVTILKSAIENGTPFIIDLFISNLSDVTKFFGNYVRNGIYIFNEHNVQEVMILRCNNITQLNANTIRMKFTVLLYDEIWFAGISSIYHIPSSSFVVQYKYHIYNVIPYIKIDQFQFNNDINNLISIHSFSYLAGNPTTIS
jgi:hypothetical protein